MAKRIAFMLFLVMAFIFSNMSAAQATPLSLYYEIEDIGGGLYNYEFTLTLDNNDGSWVSGQGWSWLTYGDRYCAPSPLTNFVGDNNDLPIGPWTYYTFSSGGHNGPTLVDASYPSYDHWVPVSIGQSLNWSGTSNAYLGQGTLLFSTLWSLNNAVVADFEIAELGTTEPVVPEPATIILFSAGLAGAFLRRRKIS